MTFTKNVHCFCLAEKAAKCSASNGVKIVTTKAVIENVGDNIDDKHLPEESLDPDNKLSSTQSDLTASDSIACHSTDDDEDDDDRVLFNDDIVCTEHGKMQTQNSHLSYCYRTVLFCIVYLLINKFLKVLFKRPISC